MPALCSELRRRSPLGFPGTFFRASPLPSFVLHPCSSPSCAPTLPRTTLARSPPLPPRSIPHGPGDILRSAPALFPVPRRATPMLSLVLRRRDTSRCSGTLFRAAPALFPSIAGPHFHAAMAVSFALLARYLSRRTGSLFCAALALLLLYCRGDLWHCACALFRALPAPSFALRRRYASRCPGAIFLAAPAVSFVLRRKSAKSGDGDASNGTG